MKVDADTLTKFYATASLGGPEKAVGFVMWRVMHRYQREVDRALAPFDLTHLQFTTLAMAGWICRSGEPATQAELARRADIHPMQISHMLKSLEQKRMVTRLRSAADTRSKLVGVTSSGLEALRAAMPVVIAIQRRMFGEDGAPGGAFLTSLLTIAGQPD